MARRVQWARGVVRARALPIAALACALAPACGGALTDTAVVAPSETRCQTTIQASASTFPHGGGRSTITIESSRDCQWLASTSAPWIGLTPSSGQGPATVAVSVAANPDHRPRTGMLSVNDRQLELTQEAAPEVIESGGNAPEPSLPAPAPGCSYRVEPAALSVPAAGGAQQLTLLTADGCRWEALSTASWIAISTPRGSGRATLRLAVARNTAEGRRSGTVRVHDIVVSVSQDGAAPAPPPPSPQPPEPACSYELNRTSESFRAEGGGGEVRVKAGESCRWTASTDAAWIALESGRSGAGTGDVRYRVAPNSSTDPRSATIAIATQALVVRQDGAKPPDKPDKPEKVEIGGPVAGLGGSCPALSFRVGGEAVITDRSTDFKHGSCADVRNGTRVTVKGARRGSEAIRAERVEIER